MLKQLLTLELLSSNIFTMQKLKDFLAKIDNVLFVPYEDLNDDSEDIGYDMIPEMKLKLRSIKKEKIIEIVSKLESNNEINITLLKCIQSVIVNNEELFTVSEVVSHGITFFDATEKIKSIICNLKQLIDGSVAFKFNGSSEKFQIELENDNLDSLLIKLLKNIHKNIVIIPSLNGRGVLSAFILIYLLQLENPSLKTKITFIYSQEKIFIGDRIVCSESWVKINNKSLHTETILDVELSDKKSCFFILNNSNLFSAVVNYVNLLGGTLSNTRKIPQLCLVQENIYEKFVVLLKNYLLKSQNLKLLDRNRQLSVNYCDNIKEYDTLLASLSVKFGLNILSSTESCGDYSSFYPTIVVDNCQPQQKLFYDVFANKFCSFLLTFRTCQEGITLANQLYRERDTVYLWTESISQCFSLKKQLKYDEIFVNIAQNYALLTGVNNYKYSCKGSFFVQKDEPESDETRLSVNDISGKLMSLRVGSKWRTESFYHRYSRVIEMMNKLVASSLLTKNGGQFLLEYLETKVKPFQFNYLVRDCLNKLTESVPVGNVVVNFGANVNGDVAAQAVLLVWLFGNDLVVVSASDFAKVAQCFTDAGHKGSIAFVEGHLRLDVVAECSFVDSVICFDDSIAARGNIGDNFPMSLLCRSQESMVSSTYESFDEIVSFVRKDKSLYILSGDVGIS